MMDKALFPPQYDQIVDLLRETEAYLVGGAVRDALLNRPIYDLDFALPTDTIGAAKRIADRLGGGFFLLDAERQTCRVILKEGDNQQLMVDLTIFQGDSIEDDLAARDFTITSMALDFRGGNRIIDPFQGGRDLQQGVIRATSERSFSDDPLRCLRAIRLAAQLGFRILPETKEDIRRFQDKLVDISSERIRDEFFRFLAGPNQHTGIRTLQLLGLDEYVLPEKLSSHQARLIRNLEDLWSLFLKDHDQDRAASWSKGLLVHRLGRYRENIREYLSQELVPGRSLYQLSFILPLLDDSGNGGNFAFDQRFDRIPLSNQERAFIENGIHASVAWQILVREGGKNQPVEVYRYFNQYGLSGVASIFLVLVEDLNNWNGEDGQKRWIEHLDLARFFLDGYWERHQNWIEPPILLDGNEIQKEFQLPPGPMIGRLLELLQEEQVRSGLSSKEEGVKFLKNHFQESDGSDV